MDKRNHFSTLYALADSLSKQHKTQQSDANRHIEVNRPHDCNYKYTQKRSDSHEGCIFFSQKDISSLRHSEAVLNGRRKRNVTNRCVDQYDVRGWPSHRK